MKGFLLRAVILAIVVAVIGFGVAVVTALNYHHFPDGLWIVAGILYVAILPVLWKKDRGEN